MRITNHRIIEQVTYNTQKRLEELVKVQDQMSSGVRVSKSSDDPGASGEILELNSLIRKSNQWQRNIEGGLSSLQSTENSLNSIHEMLIDIRATCVQGSNEGLSTDDRRALAQQLEQKLREMISVANGRFGNRYIFSASELNTPPYSMVENEDGMIEAVISGFESPQNPVEYIIGEGARLEVSVGGSEVFDLGGDETIFGIIIDLRDALLNDDLEGVSDFLPHLDDALECVSSLNAAVGTRVGSAQSLLDHLKDMEIEYDNRRSDLQDVDIVDASVKYNEEKTAYELALKTAADVIQLSLVNFIR